MPTKLARPEWSLGQVLLPDHFLALEGAFSAEGALRAGTSGLPMLGIARLEWNGDSPGEGSLWISGLTAFLADGCVVDVPGNAVVVSPLDLKKLGRRDPDVYAHILPSEDGDPAKPPAPGEIPRVIHRLVLSGEPAVERSSGRIDLGRFELDSRGQFRLSAEHIPPVVRVRGTPYLRARLEQVTQELSEFEAALDERALEALQLHDGAAPVFRVRVEVQKVLALLGDIRAGIDMHPYWLFVALRTLAHELGLLDQHTESFSPSAYAHDQLGDCFGQVLREISMRARGPQPEQSAVPFASDGGRLIASDLPAAAIHAAELYVAVLKPRSTDQFPLEGTIVASPGRLRRVQEHALRSMCLTRVPRPPLRHVFGRAVDFYEIKGAWDPPGADREWAAVARERALCFSMPKELERIRVFLCWRKL